MLEHNATNRLERLIRGGKLTQGALTRLEPLSQ
jgi:hypothetical protein